MLKTLVSPNRRPGVPNCQFSTPNRHPAASRALSIRKKPHFTLTQVCNRAAGNYIVRFTRELDLLEESHRTAAALAGIIKKNVSA